jgi:type IV pilus assembly protein PilA
MRKQKGFSLIELLIVVAIILIIAAIAVPNMQRAKMSANEAAAVASMHTIFIAETAYYAQGWNNPAALGFSSTLADLGSSAGCNPPGLHSACQLDNVMANATTPATAKSGYYYTYTPVPNGTLNSGFTLNGDPVLRGSTGQRSFYADESGVVRFNPSAVATASDLALQ